MKFLPEHFPDVIFITGNNDTSQIDGLVYTLKKLVSSLMENNKMSQEDAEKKVASIPIVISGLGGHGVAPGPIFSQSEAASLGDYLKMRMQSFKYKNIIHLEEKATNTGLNIANTKSIIIPVAEAAASTFN